jgi:radical SAM protein with 4Fe4S-binding SPASM domain
MKFAGDFSAFGGQAITFSGGGEPTQHPDLAACMRRCQEVGLEVGLMTNGAYEEGINPAIIECAQWVRFSLDTLDPQHYVQWKGVDFLDRVLSNIRKLAKGGPVKVGVNCNIHKNLTIREVDDLINMLDEYGIAYLQFRPVVPRYFRDESAELNSRVWSYLGTVHDPRINYSYDKYQDLVTGSEFPFQACEAHRVSFVVDSDGSLCPCMYHPHDQRFVFGSLYDRSLEEIWQSQQRQDVIQFLQHGLDMPRECQVCCKLCELNKLFEFLKTAKTDVNFL